jgi:hypothetical protein
MYGTQIQAEKFPYLCDSGHCPGPSASPDDRVPCPVSPAPRVVFGPDNTGDLAPVAHLIRLGPRNTSTHMPTPSSRARPFCGRRGICFCWLRPSRCRCEVVVILSEGPARSRRISLRLTALPALHLKGSFNFQLLTFNLRSNPLHSTTGSLGYFANDGSPADRSHKTNVEPRSDSIRRACTQSAQSPARSRSESRVMSACPPKPWRSWPVTFGRLP